jgi:hypothetical protein
VADRTITLANGRTVTFDIPAPGPGPAVFALSVRKCGSSVFNSMTAEVGKANGCGFVDVGGALFAHNVVLPDWQHDPVLAQILASGTIFGGFRNMPLSLLDDELFDTSPKILMVRDPRDALVSEYFSSAYSHPVPEASEDSDDTRALMMRNRSRAINSSIDAWVVRAATGMNTSLAAYSVIVGAPTTLVLRYEDYVFRKDALLRAIADHVGWRLDDALITRILTWADVVPEEEDPQRFVRQVSPGDHRRKLARRTIWRINRLLRPAMRLYGYR